MSSSTTARLSSHTAPDARAGNRARGNTSGPIDSTDFKRFRAGSHERLYEVLGCQLRGSGARFTLWAPAASVVAVVGDFNGWQSEATPLKRRVDDSSIWECEVAGLGRGALYKYRVTRADGSVAEYADPLTFCPEAPPGTASRAWRPDYAWADTQWLTQRRLSDGHEPAISIYEMDLDAWHGFPGGRTSEKARGGAPLSVNYRELARPLADYVRENAFTHIALRRVCQAYAPVASHGTPDDFMFLVDTMHQAGIGVIVDWQPAPCAAAADDPAELAMASQMRSCLLSGALFWLDRYHVDGLRFLALAPLLYLDYRRRPGEWRANRYGGRENLEAIDFLRALNAAICRDYPGALTIADDASAWPLVSRPATMGGLGFSMVRSSAWTRAALAYFRNDPWFRKFHHGQLTDALPQAFAERLVLPLGHDELADQGALFEQLPGDAWQRFAGLRSLYGYMWAHPGKKLLRIGAELGEFVGLTGEDATNAEAANANTNPAVRIDWSRLSAPGPGGLRRWVGDLNRFYRAQRALHGFDFDTAGFLWLEANDRENSVLSFLRCARDASPVLVVCNFTPVLRTSYVVGAPAHALWREALNSEAAIYGGSGAGNFGRAEAMPVPAHGQPMSLALTLPPHGILFFVPEDNVRTTG